MENFKKVRIEEAIIRFITICAWLLLCFSLDDRDIGNEQFDDDSG